MSCDNRYNSFPNFLLLLVVVGMVLIPVFTRKDSAPPLPAEKINGEYNGYKLEVVDRSTVSFTLLVSEPSMWIKAQADAFEKIEKLTGRKPVRVWSGGVPTLFFVCLAEPMEKVESKPVEKEEK